MMRNRERVIFGGFCVLGLAFSLSVEACTTANWDGASGGIAGSPKTVSRYSQQCAFEISDGNYVQSNQASDARYIARFYVLDGLTGSGDVEVLEAYGEDGAITPLFKIVFDGSQFIFDASDAGGGTSAGVPSATGWNVVEIDWDSGGNTFKYWVNADASVDTETGSVDAGAGTVEAVRLGAPNGLGTQTGKLTFDAFESHRTTPVGTLLDCDGNGNGSISIADVIAIGNELNGPLANGQPDCNKNGSVTIADVISVGNKL